MKNPIGHTNIEILTSATLVIFLFFIVAMMANPKLALEKRRDLVREDGVRNIMEMLLEMQVEDEEAFASFVGPSTAGKTMIGSADDCAGSYGARCADDFLRDECVDIGESSKKYLNEVPVDPDDEIFSIEKTGFYISFENGELEVGACNPEARGEISLVKHY